MKKKFLTLLLTAVCCLMGTQAWAAGSTTPSAKDLASITVGSTTTYYTTVADFRTGWTAISGSADVQLLGKVDLSTISSSSSRYLNVSSTQSVTLDLNGNTLTSNASSTYGTIRIYGGTLIVNDSQGGTGSIVNTNTSGCGIKAAYANSKLTLNNGHVEGKNYGIYFYRGGTYELKGGSVKSDKYSLDIAYTGANVTVSAGTYDGTVYFSSGSLSIITGTFNNYAKSTVSTDIKTCVAATSTYTVSDGNLTVTKVTQADAKASIGSGEDIRYYGTVARALSDAANGEQVLMLTNSTENVAIPAGATLNLNGKTLTGTVTCSDPTKKVVLSGSIYSTATITSTDAEAIAQIDEVSGVYYSTVAGAMAAATNGQTVKVLRTTSETESIKSKANASITLDLNGQIVNSSASDGIYIGAATSTIIVKGNGTFNYSGSGNLAYVYNSGKNLYIQSGTFNATGSAKMFTILYTGGVISLTGGTYNKDVRDYCAEGYEAVGPDASGNYVVSERVVYAASITKDGKTNTYFTVEAALSAAVSGDEVVLNANCEETGLVLNTGVTLNLNAHTLSAAPTSGDASKKVVLTGDIYSLTALTASDEASVAQNGDAYYSSVSGAVAAANDGETVTVIRTANETQPIVPPADASVTLDLNNQIINSSAGYAILSRGSNATLTITGEGTLNHTYASYLAFLSYGSNSKLIIQGGTYNNADNYSYLYATSSHTISLTGGKYIKDVTIYCAKNHTVQKDGDYYEVIALTPANAAASITHDDQTDYYATLSAAFDAVVDGQTIKLHNACAVSAIIYYTKQNVTLDLNGQTITSTGAHCILLNDASASLTITGNGTINHTGGYAMLGSNYAGGVLNIEGGTYNSSSTGSGEGHSIFGGETAGFSVTGGTFSSNEVANYCASGYAPTANGTDPETWTVSEVSEVAKIGETPYSTLSAAFAAATSGQTITLVNNTTVSETIDYTGQNITLDLGNSTITSTGDFFVLLNDESASLTITGNGTINHSGTYAMLGINFKGGVLNIEGGTYNSSSTGSGEGHAIFGGETAGVAVKVGTFNEDVTAYVASGSKIIANGTDPETWTVCIAAASITAEGVTTYYPSLYKAFAAVTTGQTITLENECTETEYIWLNSGKVVTLDMNGKNATIDGLTINNASLNITGNGKITGKSGSGLFQLHGSYNDVADYSVLTVGKNVTIENTATSGSGYVISVWGQVNDSPKAYGVKVNVYGTLIGKAGLYISGNVKTPTGTNIPEFNIEGATIKVSEGGIYQAGYSKMTFTNSTINITDQTNGGNCVEIAAGEFTMNSGTMNGVSTSGFTPSINGSITTEKGTGIYVKQHTTGLPCIVTINGGHIAAGVAICEQINEEVAEDKRKPEDISITVNGGGLESQKDGVASIYKQSEDATIKIYAGSFSQAPSASYLADGCAIIACDTATAIRPNVPLKSVDPYKVGSCDPYYTLTVYKGSSTPETKTSYKKSEWEAILEEYPNAVATAYDEVKINPATQSADPNDGSEMSLALGSKNIILDYGHNQGYTLNICPNLDLHDLSTWTSGLSGDALYAKAKKTDFYSPVSFIAGNGSYERPLNAGYNSACVPFKIEEGSFGSNEILSYSTYDEGEETVYFTYKDEITAGIPVILKPSSAKTWSVDFANGGDGTEIVASATNTAIHGTFVTENMAKQQESDPQYYAVYNSGIFGQLTGNLYPFRSCFRLQSETPGYAPARFSIAIGEPKSNPTALDEQTAAKAEKVLVDGKMMIHRNGRIYDAAGLLIK